MKTKVPIVFSFFLIKTAGRSILVDAGCESDGGFTLENFTHPIEALNNIGISASDITDVSITHAHFDHMECVGNFPNAVVYIQEQVYARSLGYLKNNKYILAFLEKYSHPKYNCYLSHEI